MGEIQQQQEPKEEPEEEECNVAWSISAVDEDSPKFTHSPVKTRRVAVGQPTAADQVKTRMVTVGQPTAAAQVRNRWSAMGANGKVETG